MKSRNPTLYLMVLVAILILAVLGGCARQDKTTSYKDDWVQPSLQGKLAMAPGYDATWTGPPERP